MNYYDEWDDLELVYRKPCLHFHHTPECGDCEHGLKSQCKINEAYLRLRKDLEDDSNYKGLAGESKTKYYNQKQVSYVENSKNKDFFRTVELELTVKKDGSKWKVNLSNEFIWTVNGQRGVE